LVFWIEHLFTRICSELTWYYHITMVRTFATVWEKSKNDLNPIN
jgi:hypothetical protein